MILTKIPTFATGTSRWFLPKPRLLLPVNRDDCHANFFTPISVLRLRAYGSNPVKNWRPPRVRGGRKRNTYEYACLLTRPDCCRNRKKVCQNLNEWIVIAIILIMYSSSTLIRLDLFFWNWKKNYPNNSSLSHEEPMILSNLIFRKLKGFQSSGVFIDWIWRKTSPKRTEFSSFYQ